MEKNFRDDMVLLDKAIIFAAERHAGQVRKDTTQPSILHPLETLSILASMNVDANLLISGVLHDILEDTGTTPAEITECFGTDIASLVIACSEDKNKTWDERKKIKIKMLEDGNLRLKTLVMADKVAELRSLYADYKTIGDELWIRLNTTKEKQAWYYDSIQDALGIMQDYPESEGVYWAMVGLYKDIFVTYFLNKEKDFLYQASTTGEAYCLKKGNPEWTLFEKKLPGKAVQLSRKKAELLEDIWNEPFLTICEQDLQDGTYNLFSSPTRYLDIKIENGMLTFSGQDFGENCKSICGDDEYEFFYSLDENETQYFLEQLRIQYGTRYTLPTILKKAFGADNGSVKFKAFCESIGVTPGFFSC